MPLYLLEQIGHVDYDETAGLVVRAKNEAGARELASMKSGDEDPGIWTDETASTCRLVKFSGAPTVILQDVNKG